MAAEEDPPDNYAGKSYKCHPKVQTSFVVCIICEEVYHISDYNRLKNTKTLSDILVICNSHGNITSKVQEKALDEKTRLLIADIKLNEKNKVHLELQEEINQNLRNTTSGEVSLTEEGTENYNSLKTHNTLLKQLYDEVKEKNKLLLNTIDLMKNNKPSYAEIIKPQKVKTPKVQNIIITSTDKNIKNEIILNNASKVIQNDTKIPISKIYSSNKNGTIIKCLKNEDVKTTYNILKNKLNSNYEVKIQQNNNPKLKIIGIANDMDKTILENDINERNFQNFENKCKVIYNFKYSSHNMQGAIIEVTSDLYEHIVNNKYKIFIGHQNCKAYDDLSISQCFNCAGFNHSSKKCNNESKCIYCAGKHKAKDCQITNKIQCANCLHANTKYNCKYDINHTASDTQQCEILKKKINISISNTDYSMRPIIPRFIGPQRSENKEITRKRRRDSVEVTEMDFVNTDENLSNDNNQEIPHIPKNQNIEEIKPKCTRQNKQITKS